MTENEILEILRDGCAPFVNLGLEKLRHSREARGGSHRTR